MTSDRLPAVHLDPTESRALLRQQATWIGVGAISAGALGLALGASTPASWGIAAGLAAIAARPPRVYLLPFALLFVVGCTILLASLGISPVVASALAAGVIVGLPGWQRTFESACAGALGAGVAWALASQVGAAGSALAAGAIVAVGSSLALLPPALRFRARPARVRMPGDDVIKVSLGEPYRPPVLQAGRLEHQLSVEAPDTPTREGLTEVAHWVWQLGLTLQALDKDIASIVPDEVEARREALQPREGEVVDAFVRDRQRGTLDHLDRLLEHRAVLVRERARSESLQAYALAYLEEARAGLAVARRLPGEHTPEALGSVLERLREHAADRSNRRDAARELTGGRA